MNATLELLRQRVAAIPPALAETLRRRPLALADAADRRWVITGGGLSEGPARFFAAYLADGLGLRARFTSLSAFAGPSSGLGGDTLVLFSQGLAPNARLPLLHCQAFRDTIVFTSVTPGTSGAGELLAAAVAGGAIVETLPPVEEAGLLVRLIGSPVQALAALRMAAHSVGAPLDLAGLPDAYAAALERGAGISLADGNEDLAPVALVASGRYTDYVFAMRWKLLEGLRLPDPPVWDALQVAHGPFQELYHRRCTLVSLVRGGAERALDLELTRRLGVLLPPGRGQRILSLVAELPAPLSWFDHDALCNALLLDAHQRRPLDLAVWPGMGEDDVIYGVDGLVLVR